MLTPIELQGKVFKTGFGYDKKDVEAFLKDVVDDYERLYKENLELNDKINVLSEGVQYYKSIEKTLQKALVLAEKTAQDTEAAASKRATAMISDAEKKASLIQQEALAKADGIINTAINDAKSLQLDAKKNLDSLRLQISSLVQQYEQYKIQYKQLLVAQKELLENEAFNIDFSSLKVQLTDTNTSESVTKPVKENDSRQASSPQDTEYEEETQAYSSNQYVIREIVPEESQVYTQEVGGVKETEQENEDAMSKASVEDDFLPTIDLAGILEEARKETEEEEQQEEHQETQLHETSSSEMEEVRNNYNDYEEENQEDLSEQDLLQQLFSVNPKKKQNKKNSTSPSDDFEFLDI